MQRFLRGFYASHVRITERKSWRLFDRFEAARIAFGDVFVERRWSSAE